MEPSMLVLDLVGIAVFATAGALFGNVVVRRTRPERRRLTESTRAFVYETNIYCNHDASHID